MDKEPEAILVRTRVDAPQWHIVDAERALTWCGLFLTQGTERLPFKDTPPELHCETCVSRFHDEQLRTSGP